MAGMFAVHGPNYMVSDVVQDLIRCECLDYCTECGRSFTPNCREMHGANCDAEGGAWPWMVGIYKMNRGNPELLCGGAIIGECWVLTAAHCFEGNNFNKSNLRVVVGDTERFVQEFSEEAFYVEQVLIHPEFDRKNGMGSYNKDIALLKLSCNVTCSPRVSKACLPKASDSIYYQAGTRCIVTGWGATKRVALAEDAGPKSTQLKELHLPITNQDKCRQSMIEEFRKDVTEFTVCAGDGTGRNDTCQGDSGGALFCKRNDQDSYVIVGIVSWGEGCKQPKKYGVYTHVLKLIDWVYREMSTRPCERPRDPDEEEKICPKPKTIV